MIKDFCRYTKRFFQNKVFKIILYILIAFILILLKQKVVNASSVGASNVSWQINFDQCKNQNGSVNCVDYVTRGNDTTTFNMSSNRYSSSDLSSYTDNLISGWYNMGDSVAIRSMVFTFNGVQVTTSSSGRKQIRLQIPFITNNTDYITSSGLHSGTQNITKSKEYFPGLPFYSFNYQDQDTWVRGSALHMKPYAIKVYQKTSGQETFSWVDYTQYNQVYWGSSTYQYGVALNLPNSAEISKVKLYVGSPTHFKGSYTDFQNKWAIDDYSKLTSYSSMFSNSVSDYIAYCGSSTCKFMPSYQTVYMDLSPSSTITDRMVYISTLEQIDENIIANQEIENINYQNGQLIGDNLTGDELEDIFENSKNFIDVSNNTFVTNLSELVDYFMDEFIARKNQDIFVNGEVNYNMCMSYNVGGAHSFKSIPIYRDPQNHSHIWSIDLPCMPEKYLQMNNEYQQYKILNILQIIIRFIFAWLLANSFIKLVHSSIDPQDTKIEVLDL